MPLKLTRSLAFLDLETTGTDPVKDRIVQLAMLKWNPDGSVSPPTTLLMNPGIPISPEATAIHGISDKDVAHLPGFARYQAGIHEYLDGCDLGGYNIIRFDIPLLSEEFARQNVRFPKPGTRFVDPQAIFFLKEPRTLAAAYQFYCGKRLVRAHDATADTLAAYEVFLGQMAKYNDLGRTIEELDRLCSPDPFVDPARKLTRNPKGEIVYAFGKNQGKAVTTDPDYAKWVLGADFPAATKMVIKELLKGLDRNL